MMKASIFLLNEINSLKKRGKNSVRFAPSPTGKFHVGNFRTAWASKHLSHELGLPLWVRYEDIDSARVNNDFLKTQIRELSFFDVESLPVDAQSKRLAFYEELFKEGARQGIFYPCSCSRKTVQEDILSMQSAPHFDVPLYSGVCRVPSARPTSLQPTIGWRLKSSLNVEGHQDILVGKTNNFSGELTDSTQVNFQPSYHFACAADDYFSQCLWIVRSWDLKSAVLHQRELMKTFQQLFLANSTLDFPSVFHTSLVTDNHGHRLEKRTQGVTLDELLKKYQLAELKKIFFNSFSGGAAIVDNPLKIYGEAKKTLTLLEIGLK